MQNIIGGTVIKLRGILKQVVVRVRMHWLNFQYVAVDKFCVLHPALLVRRRALLKGLLNRQFHIGPLTLATDHLAISILQMPCNSDSIQMRTLLDSIAQLRTQLRQHIKVCGK